MVLRLTTCAFLCLAFALPALGDVVEMADGSFLEGKILKEAKDFITLLTTDRKKKVLSRNKIRRVMRGMTLYDIYAGKRAILRAGDAKAHLALGHWCEKYGLKGLAVREFRKAVGLDPELVEAREKLGHVRWEGKWYASESECMKARGFRPFRGKWLTPEALEKEAAGFHHDGGDWFTTAEWNRLKGGRPVALPVAEDWGMYRTRHYRLFTRLREAKSLKFADMAEQAFAAFEAHFGFAPIGILEGNVFGTLKAFEDFAVGRRMATPGKLYSHGFFDGGTRKIFFPYIDDDYTTVNILIHELCHQFEVLAKPGGRVPVWFFEGIACVFGHHLWNGKKLVTGQLAVKKNFNLYYLQQRIRTGKQMSLKAILTGSPGAKVDPVFYNHAWGLTWFLMKTDGYAGKFKAYQDVIHSPESVKADPLTLFHQHFGPLEQVEKDFLRTLKGIRGIPWRGEGKPAGQKR
ncbi:MAG: tetratricopeptide repeat protein [Planctomycetota bacterium]|jgi:hypothetical protein